MSAPLREVERHIPRSHREMGGFAYVCNCNYGEWKATRQEMIEAGRAHVKSAPVVVSQSAT